MHAKPPDGCVLAHAQVPDSELPELPGELAGIWAYIKWEVAGCPNRSQQESDAAYQASIEARPFLFLHAWPGMHLHGTNRSTCNLSLRIGIWASQKQSPFSSELMCMVSLHAEVTMRSCRC
jgi:hypothetical protein